jgi:predicted HAD superfamily Cof-like phosphohydrolase
MNEQNKISEWLTLAGKQAPKTPRFPDDDKFQLGLNLILEELLEAAESGPDEQVNIFLDNATKMIEDTRFKIFKRERGEGDLNELRDACADLRVVLGNLIHFTGISKQFNEDFSEVMDSNFSKFCLTEEQANKSVEAYENGNHPNKFGNVIECYHEKVGEYWIIKRKGDNKVLKSIGFKEPNFK